eukprot:gene16612-biopygen5282
MAAWGPGPGGLGRPRWPAKNHEIHLIRHGQTKKVASRIWIEDFVSAIRSLKPPLWRGFLWSTSGPALGPGAATLACQKSRKSSHQTRGIGKSGKSYLARLHCDLSNTARIEQFGS